MEYCTYETCTRLVYHVWKDNVRGCRVSPMTKPAANSVMRNTAPLQHNLTCGIKADTVAGHSFEQATKNAMTAMQKCRAIRCLRVLLVFKPSAIKVCLRTTAFSELVCHKAHLTDLM